MGRCALKLPLHGCFTLGSWIQQAADLSALQLLHPSPEMPPPPPRGEFEPRAPNPAFNFRQLWVSCVQIWVCS